MAMPDGSIWWSGQFANKLGRLDPQSGELREYPLPNPAGPHGLINDKDGNIWYAGNFGGHIGKLDPKTGEVKVYKMPDPKARDPHTPLFDKNGILWFSVQNGGFMGRLDPKTGDIKLVTPAGGPGQQPYALRFLSDGVTPWFSYFGSNKLAKVDPVTMQSTNPKIFFGGDSAFGPKNIIWAVAHGHEAAVSIDLFCNGEDVKVRPSPLVNIMSQKMGIHEWSYDNDV